MLQKRCEWVGENPLMIAYHDTEWGTPAHDDRMLFEYLILDSAQAGLSWQTILNKRENYRRALENFNPEKIAAYTDADEARLMGDPGIIRNRLKVRSHIQNARVFLEIQKECGSFDSYIWKWVGEKPIVNHPRHMGELMASTALSTEISNDLKRRGMNFVGPTIIYAFMQSAGLVNDHEEGCYRISELVNW